MVSPSRDYQIRGLYPAHVPQHHFRRQNDRSWINLILAGIFWRGAVSGLEHGNRIAKICARCNADTAHLRRQGIGNVVAVQIQCSNHIIFLRTQQNLLQKSVRDHILDNDPTLVFGKLHPWPTVQQDSSEFLAANDSPNS